MVKPIHFNCFFPKRQLVYSYCRPLLSRLPTRNHAPNIVTPHFPNDPTLEKPVLISIESFVPDISQPASQHVFRVHAIAMHRLSLLRPVQTECLPFLSSVDGHGSTKKDVAMNIHVQVVQARFHSPCHNPRLGPTRPLAGGPTTPSSQTLHRFTLHSVVTAEKNSMVSLET